jgi:dTDP-4-amino-4,6-dideoxygalactose transaminase
MNIKQKIKLIPRYNWDYGVVDLFRSAIFLLKGQQNATELFKTLFESEPIFTNAGRTSLYAILKALDLPKGAQVGVPLYCCPVVFDAIRQAGLTLKFIDISLENYCLSPTDLEKKIRGIKALVPVHMFGNPADIESILTICGEIEVIEDCAQSLYSRYKGYYTGTLSGCAFFSFRSGKYISAGEGSAILMKNSLKRKSAKTIIEQFEQKKLYHEMLNTLETYLKSTFYKRPWYGTIGYPLGKRIDRKMNLTAKTGFAPGPIGKSNLAVIEHRMNGFIQKVNRQRSNAKYLLNNIDGKKVILPREQPHNWNNYSQFAIRFENETKRDRMAAYLFKHGVDSAKYGHEIVDIAKKEYGYRDDCRNSEYASKTVLVIPNHYTLGLKELKHVADCVNKGSLAM